MIIITKLPLLFFLLYGFFSFQGCSLFAPKISIVSENEAEKSVGLLDSPLSYISQMCSSGDFANAEKKMDELYKSEQLKSSYWNQIGNCYYMQGDLLLAKFYYYESLKRNSQFIPTLNNLALTLLKSGELKKAQLLLKEAISLNTRDDYAKILQKNLTAINYNYAM